MKCIHMVVLCALLATLRGAWGAQLAALVDDLNIPDKRAASIDAILKKGAAAEAELKQLEASKQMAEPQATLLKRLLGNILIDSSTLKPFDTSKLKPIGYDEQKGERGDPRILIDPDPKTRAKNRAVVLTGHFALDQGALEYLVVSKGQGAKTHESVLCVDALPLDIFTALTACDYDYANFTDEGDVSLPKTSGVQMSVEFEWETPSANPAAKPDPNKRLVRVPLQYFAYNLQTQKTMRCVPFAFTGSVPVKNPQTGVQTLAATFERSIAAVRFDPTALLNSPLNTRNINPLHAEGYTINWHIVPKPGTACTLIFEPYGGPELSAADLSDTKQK